MTLVTGPVFQPEDLKAVEASYFRRETPRHEEPASLFRALKENRARGAEALGFLLHRGLLKLFIARPANATGNAIYHEKFALFSQEQAAIAISGSGNESGVGWSASFERFEVFRSWASGAERLVAERMRTQFDALVRNETEGLEVLPLLDAYRKGWLGVRMKPGSEDEKVQGGPIRSADVEMLVPFPFALFEHQKRAVKRWARAGGKGLLAMATGSGKTVTALTMASQLFDALGPRPLGVIIIAPFIHLVDQWIGEARRVGLAPIRCAEGAGRWQDELSTAVFALNSGARPLLSVAVTVATLQSTTFQELIGRIRTSLLVIGDEAHNLGSPSVAQALPRNAAYRVGLSATPERWMDPTGTARIHGYFGNIVDEYSMKDALDDEVLVPYIYYPQLVALEPEEAIRYEEISAKLAKYGISDSSDELSEGAKALLMKRARLLASARGKLPILRALLRDRIEDTHMLIYCGDGRPEVEDDALPPRQIEEVAAILRDLGIASARYTSETPPDSRRTILREFDEGNIQALIAIRCLDEGVDIPSTRTAFILSSSTNPRQFIQRRGRVLRRSPRTGKTRAEIFDFFVLPVPDEERSISNPLQGMVRTQLERVLEFSSLAINGPQARRELVGWTEKNGLMGLWGR